jgi:hypothetical protein
MAADTDDGTATAQYPDEPPAWDPDLEDFRDNLGDTPLESAEREHAAQPVEREHAAQTARPARIW